METELSRRLLDWYAQAARHLPWRDQPSPYRVWVSEIMLQQTQVKTVLPYFDRWMQRFPTIEALAEAPLQGILQAWEGLGYYSRARNLWQAARRVVGDWGGKIPEDTGGLRSLPGIGEYTAGAIASIAFGADEPALDGNIRRVLARVFDVIDPARSPAGEGRLWALARQNLPPGRAGDYNQALMDLGASICTPRLPDCPVCPVKSLCLAFARGVQGQRPVMAPRKHGPHHIVTAAVIHRWSGDDRQVLIARRPPKGLLGGMYEFPGGKLEPGEELPGCLRREIREELGVEISVGEEIGVYRHAYTHFSITLHAFHCSLISGEPQPLQVADVAWVTVAQLGGYPMGKIDRRIAKDLQKGEK